DIYSLGCTLYQLLAGEPPHRHQMKEPPPLDWKRSAVSPVLAAVVRRMMARMPEVRYPAAIDVVTALTPFCYDRTEAPRSVGTGGARETTTAEKSRALYRLFWLAVAGILILVILGIIGLGRARGAAPSPVSQLHCERHARLDAEPVRPV